MNSQVMGKSESLCVETWPLDDIKPYPNNPRHIPESAIKKVAASLKEFGWRQPIVLDRNGVIIVGHTRYLAAQHLKLKEAPVHVAKKLTKKQVNAYRLADNRTSEETSWDLDGLNEELSALLAVDFDITLTGFDELEALSFAGEDLSKSEAAWTGMPAYENDDLSPKHSVKVNFASDEDRDAFFKLVKQPDAVDARSIWYPKAEIERMADKAFVDDDAA